MRGISMNSPKTVEYLSWVEKHLPPAQPGLPMEWRQTPSRAPTDSQQINHFRQETRALSRERRCASVTFLNVFQAPLRTLGKIQLNEIGARVTGSTRGGAVPSLRCPRAWDEAYTRWTRNMQVLREVNLDVRLLWDQKMICCYKIGVRCDINGRQWQDQDETRRD